MKKSILISSVLVAGSVMIGIPSAYADGCAPGEPCWEQYQPQPVRMEAPAPAPVRQVIPTASPVRQVVPTASPVRQVIPTAAPVMMEESDINMALSAGLNVMHYDCNEAHVAPGVYADFRKADLPVNVRVGVEASNLNSDQFKFSTNSAFAGTEPDFVLVRIPVSVEYVVPVTEETEFLIGGGPDLLHTSGNGADADVGFHLGARIVQDLGSNLTASVGAGYLWGETEAGTDEDLDLDSAFTGASLGYRF